MCTNVLEKNITFRFENKPSKKPACSRWLSLPEDGNDMFFQNTGLHTDYTALYPRRWQAQKSNIASDILK
jgi:hypothetical protein